MAQAFACFGSEVCLFEKAERILTREDSDAAAIVQDQMQRDGVCLMLNSSGMTVKPTGDGGICISVTQNGVPGETIVDQLLVAVGRAPNTDGLNLEAVNVKYGRSGVDVNDHLQTSHPRIYAAGDICSKYQFTHAADFQARIVIQNALFAIGPFGRKKASSLIIPWATYTSPEVAHVGMYAHEAQEADIEIDTYVQELAENDRAILEGQGNGFVKVHTKKGTDQIVGTTIVAENAGDLISEITLAMANGFGLSKIGSTIHPYPSQADAMRRLGDQ